MATRLAAYAPASNAASAATLPAQRAYRQPQNFNTSVNGMVSSRIIQLGRMPSTSAATAPVASVHINQPKAAVTPAMMRATADGDSRTAVADADGRDWSTRFFRGGGIPDDRTGVPQTAQSLISIRRCLGTCCYP